MVVGGGPAGMSAALSAHEKGHSVTLYERSSRLGGQLFLAAKPPGREEFAELAKDLSRQITLRGIAVRLNQEVDEAVIERERPDEVIVATGATPITPRIPGVERKNVVQAWDVLQNKAIAGRDVIIIGGGAVGVETALFLAEKGTLSGDAVKFLLVNKAEDCEDLYQFSTRGTKKITVIEMLDAIGKDIGRSTRWCMMQDLARKGVETRTATRALEITDSGIKAEVDGAVMEMPADTIVLAVGARPYNPLKDVLEKKGIPYHVAGDAGHIALAFDATHAGFAAGRKID
jgi:2,4-dienoyl-CoA reductase (NADPH2)